MYPKTSFEMSQVIKNPLLSIHAVKTPRSEFPSIHFPLLVFAPTEEDWNQILDELELKASYFHRDMDRHVAECFLMEGASFGTYLLRNSNEHGEEYFLLVLSVRGYHSVKHFKVIWDGDKFTFGRNTFASLDFFLEHLRSTPILAEASGSFLPVQNALSKASSVGNIFDAIDAYGSDFDTPDPVFHRQSPLPDLTIASKEGYLTVQATFSKKWQTIWVAVNKMILSCFKHKEQSKAYQTLDLNEFSVEIDAYSPNGNGFKLFNVKRSIVFRTNTRGEVQAWMKLIQWKMEQKSTFTLYLDK